MIITATQFTLSTWKRYLEFFADTYRVVKQVRHAGGIIRVRINPITLRTVTAWTNREDMIRFRNTGSHLAAMKKSDYFGTIVSTTWESETVPDWKEVISRLEVIN